MLTRVSLPLFFITDPAQLEQLAMQCLEDPDGLCGDMCVKAITSSAANPQVANVKVPCTGGVDGLIENVLKKCTEELGAPFDPCGGKTKKAACSPITKKFKHLLLYYSLMLAAFRVAITKIFSRYINKLLQNKYTQDER